MCCMLIILHYLLIQFAPVLACFHHLPEMPIEPFSIGRYFTTFCLICTTSSTLAHIPRCLIHAPTSIRLARAPYSLYLFTQRLSLTKVLSPTATFPLKRVPVSFSY